MFSCEESLIFIYYLLDFISNNIIFQPFDTFGNFVTTSRVDGKFVNDLLFFYFLCSCVSWPSKGKRNLPIINVKKRRSYMSNEEKVNVSKNIPLNFKEIICLCPEAFGRGVV